MQVSEITLYNILKGKFAEQEAQAIVEGIKQEVKREVDEHKDILASKQDIYNLRVEMKQDKIDLIKRMFGFFAALILAILGLYFKH